MARGLAHDLNNVLATILGHAEIVKMKTLNNPTTQEHLEQIIFSTERVGVMINRMLTYSGRTSIPKKSVNPTVHLESVFNAVATLQPAEITMQISLSPELPDIAIDPSELEGAIQNLLQNSINALDDKRGKIVLKAAYEEITKLPTDYFGNDLTNTPSLRIEVEDTGRGMTDEAALRALEPFFSTRANGKGLGLVNVLSTVENAGGALYFQSEQNVGTRFVLWFPLNRTVEKVTPQRDISLEKLRVLLVEDEVEVAKVLSEILQSFGVMVEYYHCCETVMAQINTNELSDFDIAILDVRLGSIDGIEIGHHLLYEQIVDSLLFISGDEPGQRFQQFSSDKVRFLRKPIGVQNLRSTLMSLLSES